MVRNEAPIAQIYFKKKIAQRRYSDSVIWEHLQDQSKLYNEDIIRTENGAVAIINFDNEGPTVQIEENTMIQIFASKDGELNLSLTGGNVSIDTTQAKKKVQVKLGNGSVVNLEKGSRMSTSNEAGKDSIIIQEGTGSVVSENGDEEIIPAGSTIKIDENGKRSKVPVSVDNLTTTYKVLKFADEEKKVEFNIKSDAEIKDSKVIVEISKDSDFKTISEKKIVSAEDKIELSTDSGNVYYRVYSEGDVENAFNGKLIVENISRPQLISPKQNVVFESVNLMPEILFSWDAGSYCDYSIIEIFDEDDASNPVIRKEVFGNSCKVSSLNEGNFFWHITPHYAVNTEVDVKPSSDYRFTIVRQNVNFSPVLSVPAVGLDLVLGKEDKPVLFAWKSDVKGGEYNLQISKDKNFENVIFESQEDSLKRTVPLNIKKLVSGNYYWRVFRIDENNKKFFSNVRDFTVSEYVPQETQLVYPPENYSIETARSGMTQFAWKLSDSFDKENCVSVFEISQNENFNSVMKIVKTSDLSLRGINLDEGNYFWRIRVLDKNTEKEISKTSARKLSVVKELEMPVITGPVNNSTVGMISNNSIRVVWNKVEDADYYKVKLYDDATDSVLTQVDSSADNSINLVLPDDVVKNLAGKKFRTTVQAFTQEKGNAPARASKINSVSISIESIKKIILEAPVNNAKIDGLAALRNPLVFKWTSDGLIASSEFILTRINSNGTTSVVSSVKNPENGSVSLKRLGPGTYRWTVKAVNVSGSNISPDRNNTFTISQVPALKDPILVNPSDNFVIDIPYLRNFRTVPFKWAENKAVNEYLFELYQRNENGTLKRILSKTLNGNSFILSDLTVLDVGEFEWHVTAFRKASDGFVEQKSSVVSNRFSVNLDLPDTVKVKDTGRLYGE